MAELGIPSLFFNQTPSNREGKPLVFLNLWHHRRNGKYEDLPKHGWVDRQAAQSGFHRLDLLAGFEGATGGNLNVLKGECEKMHPNEKGHEAVAQIIEAYLLKEKLIHKERT